MRKIVCLILIPLLLTACFKDEPGNSECDITDAWIEGEGLERYFYNVADMRISDIPSGDQKIVFTVRSVSDLPPMALYLNMTQGATSSPANGSVQDFSKGPVIYTVTSEDGQWHREYTVSFTTPATPPVTERKMKLDFERFKLDETLGRYYVWYELAADGTENDEVWASGNAGFIIAKPNAAADDYPTTPDENGYEGNCVKLTTRDTGKWGKNFGKPLAAGNLFFGEFDSQYAITKTLWTTKMGIPIVEEPLKVTGYYKYKAGDVFKDKNSNVVPGRVDEPSIYAVFYRNQNAAGESVVLHGDDVKTSDLIVSIAEVASLPETDEWKPFEMEFVSKLPVDKDILAQRGYNMAFVFSSSKAGDTFEGAVGSTLYVDKVEITFKKDQTNP